MCCFNLSAAHGFEQSNSSSEMWGMGEVTVTFSVRYQQLQNSEFIISLRCKLFIERKNRIFIFLRSMSGARSMRRKYWLYKISVKFFNTFLKIEQ
jgi:hypothetical protein